VREVIKDDNAAAMLLREVVRDQVTDLETQLKEVERALAQPMDQINLEKLKRMVSAAIVTIAQMKLFCP
jgi:hypothetical protein